MPQTPYSKTSDFNTIHEKQENNYTKAKIAYQLSEETYTPNEITNDIVGARDSNANIDIMNQGKEFQSQDSRSNSHIYDGDYLKNAHDANGGSDTNRDHAPAQQFTDK